MNPLKRERLEPQIKQRDIARTLKVSDTTVSNYLNGMKRPPEDVLKKILLIYAVVRAEHLRIGYFRFDEVGIALLRRKIREMQRSEKSPQPVNDALAQESTACAG